MRGWSVGSGPRGVAEAIAKATGETARHIRERGFDKQYYLDLILELVRRHGPVGRKEIDDVLIPKLSDRLSGDQKRVRVRNLVQELRRGEQIENRGTRSEPEWVVGSPDGSSQNARQESREGVRLDGRSVGSLLQEGGCAFTRRVLGGGP